MDDETPDTITSELAEAGGLAKQLVEHLGRMGAESCKIPVTAPDGKRFIVFVKQEE